MESVHPCAWSLTQAKDILSAHVLVADYAGSEHPLQEIQALLNNKFPIYFSTIQIETEVCPEIEIAEEVDFLRR